MLRMSEDGYVKGNGWSDIGYHYLIKLDGTVQEGRPINKIGAHVGGHNRDSIGIAYVGGMDKNMRSGLIQEQISKRILYLIY